MTAPATAEMTTTTTSPPLAPAAARPADTAFPRLGDADLAAMRPFATCAAYADGDVVFRAGEADVDLFVVESGEIVVSNPVDHGRVIATHGPGEFTGDIDLLTRRPVIVTGVARGSTHLLRVPGRGLRELLIKVPNLSERLLVAFQARRRILDECGHALGLRVVGPGECSDTTLVREFLHKNFVPFTWYDSKSDEGRAAMVAWGSPTKSPVIETGAGELLINPSLRELAKGAGVWRDCPAEPVDLAVVGAGPAGMAAAVYAASEGLSTVVLDRLGPGGQAGGSSKIENFIGFPSGLSGTDLATRGVLQMLKFGAKMVAPVTVDRLEPAAGPGDLHALHLDCGAVMRARTVLVATGVHWRRLDAEGASRFERAGVYYACTTVEALLHDGTDVAVVGAGNSAGQAVMFLAECCPSRRVHLLIRHKLGPGMSEYLSSRIRARPNVTVHEGVEVASVHGTRRLEALKLRERRAPAGDGAPGGGLPPGDAAEQRTLPVSAVFVFIGAEPTASFLPESAARDKLGYLLTGADAARSGKWPLADREPCPIETTIPGVCAAGDVRAGSTKRVGFAVGDGSMAVTCVHRLVAIRA